MLLKLALTARSASATETVIALGCAERVRAISRRRFAKSTAASSVFRGPFTGGVLRTFSRGSPASTATTELAAFIVEPSKESPASIVRVQGLRTELNEFAIDRKIPFPLREF
jgi:hypothetical protein